MLELATVELLVLAIGVLEFVDGVLLFGEGVFQGQFVRVFGHRLPLIGLAA